MQATKALAPKRGNATETLVPKLQLGNEGKAAESNGMATVPPPDDLSTPILNRLLRMADNYKTGGNLWQAEEMYRTLMEDYADTPQAEDARKRLMDLCEAYELDGQLHHARSLYERLL